MIELTKSKTEIEEILATKEKDSEYAAFKALKGSLGRMNADTVRDEIASERLKRYEQSLQNRDEHIEGNDMTKSVVVTKEEKLFVAKDEKTGVASQGRTESEALENLKEALELYNEDESKSGSDKVED